MMADVIADTEPRLSSLRPFPQTARRPSGDAHNDDDFILSSLLAGTLRASVEVKVTGLVNAPQLNGLAGSIISFDRGAGRYKVQCDNGQNIALKAENILVSRNAPMEDTAIDGDLEDDAPQVIGLRTPVPETVRIVLQGRNDEPRTRMGTANADGFVKSSLLYKEFPILSIALLGGLTWLTVLVVMLIYIPRA